jgi:hypothetical protein
MVDRQKGYHEDIWKAIRILWETNSKISIRLVRQTVSDALQTEVPSESVIDRRRIKEGWRKGGSKRVKTKKIEGEFTLSSLPPIQEKKVEETEVKKYIPPVKKNVKSELMPRDENQHDHRNSDGIDLEPIFNLAQKSVNHQAEIINRFRQRSEDIGVMLDRALEDLPRYADSETLADAKTRMDIIKSAMDVIKNHGAVSFGAWAITMDMLDDSQGKTKARTIQLQDYEKDLAIKREVLNMQKDEMIERRALFREQAQSIKPKVTIDIEQDDDDDDDQQND